MEMQEQEKVAQRASRLYHQVRELDDRLDHREHDGGSTALAHHLAAVLLIAEELVSIVEHETGADLHDEAAPEEIRRVGELLADLQERIRESAAKRAADVTG